MIPNNEIESILLEQKNKSKTRLQCLLKKTTQQCEIDLAKRVIRKWDNTLKFYHTVSKAS
jgi:hypothetical protein